jgi:DNA polymerase-3 subunit beta
MKLKFAREDAVQALMPLQGVLSSKSMLPILSHLCLEADKGGIKIIGSDLDMWVSSYLVGQVEEEGAATIPGRRFSNLIRELPGEEIALETDDSHKAKITCLRSRVKMMGMAREEFPAQPDLGETIELKLEQKVLRRLLRQTAYAISQDETRYVLSGLNLVLGEGKMTAVATDGRRLSLAYTEIDLPADISQQAILPAKIIHELSRVLGDEGELTIKIGSNQAAFEMDGLFISSRLISGKFPNYQQVIPKESKEKIKLPRLELLAVIRRAKLFTSEKSNSIKFSFKPGLLEVSSITPEVGESQEEMNIEYGGEPMEIAFNPQYVIDVLKSSEEAEEVQIELLDASSPGVIRTDERFTCIIMPMKLN